MTTAPTLEESAGPTRVHPRYAVAKIGAWYLLIAGVLHFGLEQFFKYKTYDGVFGLIDTLTFGAEPTLDLPYVPALFANVAYVLLLGVGLILVQAKFKVGARIVYGVYAAFFLYAFFRLIFIADYMTTSYVAFARTYGFSELRGRTYMWLALELLGFAITVASVIAIYIGMRHAPKGAPKATSAQVAAARAQQDQEWRVAEVKKWQEAYSLANNGEAPPAGFMPPIAARGPQTGTNVMAILALVFGIGGGLLGVIFGHVALSQIKRTGESGRGLAIAGLVLGYIGLTLLIAWLIFVVILANSDPYSY